MRILRIFAAIICQDMDNAKAIELAEKIAKLITSESKSGDLALIQKSLDQIKKRLEKLESASEIPQSAIPIPQSTHPSLNRFAIAEAIVDSLFDRDAKEKACTFEPNGKPCDHCSMCSSLGF